MLLQHLAVHVDEALPFPRCSSCLDARSDLWAESGSTDIVQRSRERVKSLMQRYPSYVTPEQDAAIRAKFDIKLAEGDMKRGNGRW